MNFTHACPTLNKFYKILVYKKDYGWFILLSIILFLMFILLMLHFISNVYKTPPIVAHSDIYLLSGGGGGKRCGEGPKRNLTKSIFVSQNAFDEI